jgi:hypothetical protein
MRLEAPGSADTTRGEIIGVLGGKNKWKTTEPGLIKRRSNDEGHSGGIRDGIKEQAMWFSR